MSLRSISSRPIMSLVVSALVLLITLEFLFDFEVSIFPDIHELSMLPSRQWHQIVDWYANYMNSKNPALETNVLGKLGCISFSTMGYIHYEFFR
jgi:hypothetical protein